MTLLGDLGPTIVAVLWVETSMACVFVIARVYSRKFVSHSVGYDDYLAVVTLLFFILYSLFCTLAATRGLGRHSTDLTVPQLAEANKMEIIGETMYLVGLATSKATVATFLLRIVAKTWHKLVLYFIIISTAIVCFFCALFNYVQCSPVAHVWNPTIPATCWMSVEPLAVFTGAWGAAVDFALVILPWLILARLQMERKKKLVILFSMSLGIFAGICGIIRSVAVQGLSSATDYTYDTISLILWSSTEITFTVIAACIPAIRPLWRDITSVRGVSLSRSRKGTNSGRSKSERYQLGAFANDVYSGPEGSRATLNPQAVENVEARTRTTPLHTDDGIERIREVSVTYQYNNRDSSMAEVV